MASNALSDKPVSSFAAAETSLILLSSLSGILLVWKALTSVGGARFEIIMSATFLMSLLLLVRLVMDPDSIRARQSDKILKLASQTLDYMKDGMTPEAAQKICSSLLSSTAALAVSITDKTTVIGYSGFSDFTNVVGRPVRTQATMQTLTDGQERVLFSAEDIGLGSSSTRINGAIIMPLYVGHDIVGALKFYYNSPRRITQTQYSMAEGFAKLLSVQMASIALEEQKKIATSLELKTLQAQINPHFLFNTINTIASLTRTDPAKARVLLRDFAVFYRSTLEDASDLIPLEREVAQVKRYFSLELARFGEEQLELIVEIDSDLEPMMVPSFMLQPLVENSVKYGRTGERKLSVKVSAHHVEDNVVVCVADDGVGMTEEKLNSIMNPDSEKGLGMAVKNVRDRMRGYFGPSARMDIVSEQEVGTMVSFVIPPEIEEEEQPEDEELLKHHRGMLG